MESPRSSLQRDCQQAATRMGVTLALCEIRRHELGSDGISFDSRKRSQGMSSISGYTRGKDPIFQARILLTLNRSERLASVCCRDFWQDP